MKGVKTSFRALHWLVALATPISVPAAELSLRSVAVTNRTVVATATGDDGSAIVLETSVDLRNWVPLRAATLTGAPYAFSVPAGEADVRAYRLRTAAAAEIPSPLAIRATENGDFRRSLVLLRDAPASTTLTDDNGVIYDLEFPAGCVLAAETVVIQVVNVVADWPLAGTYLGGVRLEPEGLRLLGGATLRITVPDGPAPAAPGVAWHDTGSEFHAVPVSLSGRSVIFPLARLGGYGVVSEEPTDRAVWAAHPPTSFEEQDIQAFALSLLPGAAAPARHGVARPMTLSPKQLARIEEQFRQRIRPRLADAAGDDAALEPALLAYTAWRGSCEVVFTPDEVSQLAALFAAGDQLAIDAIEATLRRASRNCDRHDLRSLGRMVRAGQLFERPPWAPAVPAFEKNLFRQMVKNCATFDLDLDAIVDSTSQVGAQHSRVHWHWSIGFRDEALTALTGAGPAPLSEVDYRSTTVCTVVWSPTDGGVEIPEFSLGINFRDVTALPARPSAAAMKVLFNPFLVPPSEHYAAICPVGSTDLGNYWAAAFGKAYQANLVRLPRGEAIQVAGWQPGSGDLLGTRSDVAASIQASGFTARVSADWQLRHVPTPF